MSKTKIFAFLFISLLVGWGGYVVYTYIFDESLPNIELHGIEHEGFCCGDVQCTLTGSDDYKVANISIGLDGEPIIKHHVINRKKFEYNFPIATRNLSEGPHTLVIKACDGSYKKNSTTKEIHFTVDNLPLRTAFATNESMYKVFQGRTLHVQFQVNKPISHATIEVLSQIYPCYQEADGSPIYECFVPVRSDENPHEHLFTITIYDNVGNKTTLTNKLQVVLYPFKKQILTINEEKRKKEHELGLSEKEFYNDLQEALKNASQKKLWKTIFYVPCEASSVSTDFGTLRTTQQRGKYRHDAVDLIAPPHSVVWASQDGKVLLKNRYAHSGNTIVLDHGCGVITMYFHLEDFADINVGDFVAKGKPIGKLGMTGYATGFHLHWEMWVNGVAVDPMQWTKNDF